MTKERTTCNTCGKPYNPSNLPLDMALINARDDRDKCEGCHKDDNLKHRPFEGLKEMMNGS